MTLLQLHWLDLLLGCNYRENKILLETLLKQWHFPHSPFKAGIIDASLLDYYERWSRAWIATEPAAPSTSTLVQWFIKQLFNCFSMTDNKYVESGSFLSEVMIQTNLLRREEFIVLWLLTVKEKKDVPFSYLLCNLLARLLCPKMWDVFIGCSERSYLHSSSMHLFCCCCFVSSGQNFLSDFPV